MMTRNVVVWMVCLLFPYIQGWTPICPRKCTCQTRPVHVALLRDRVTFKTIDCSSLSLLRIPLDLPADAEALLLRNNSIRMHVGINLMPQLRVLDLTRNRIQGFFGRMQLPLLEHLDLSYNIISRVSSGDNDFFSPLRNLKTLNLRGNMIHTIHVDSLELPRLTTLDVAENRLTHVDDHVLNSLQQLKKVDFSDNGLRGEAFGDVFGGTQIETVNLSGNQLDMFMPHDVFHVDHLDLSRNAFTALSQHTINGTDVRYLNLSQQPNLWLVSASAFQNMTGLHMLDLAGNEHLTYIEPGSFVRLTDLASVNLDDTGLVKLPADFMEVEKLSVSLRRVPLSCYLNSDLFAALRDKNLTCRWRGQTLDVTQLSSITNTTEWINALPVILPTFPLSVDADVGSILELQCLTAGNVTGIDWIRTNDRRKWEYSLPSQAGVLRLGPMYRVMAGHYVCRAHNEFGSVNRSIYVNVTFAPVIIIPLTVGQQHITFAWNNSDASIAPQFRVAHYELIAGNFTHIRTVQMGHLVRSYTINGLKTGTLYKICLLLNKTGTVEELDCRNITTQHPELSRRSFQSAQELVIAIACISSLLFMIFMSTCVYRFYQEKQQDSMAESLSRILLSDSSCTASEAATPTTYFNPGIDPLTPTTDLDVRAAFLPEHHPYRNAPLPFQERQQPHMQSTQF